MASLAGGTCIDVDVSAPASTAAQQQKQKRSLDANDSAALLHVPHKSQRSSVERAVSNPHPHHGVVWCGSVCGAAEALLAADSLATMVKRPLPTRVADSFVRYVASQPCWPNTQELHPMEATHARVAIIEFPSKSPLDTIDAAKGYGRGLPPRHHPQVASARAAIAHVLSVLPDECAAAAMLDASDLLSGLRMHHHTKWRQFIVRLELVRGDTCQRWHRDLNICRSIVTYVVSESWREVGSTSTTPTHPVREHQPTPTLHPAPGTRDAFGTRRRRDTRCRRHSGSGR